MSVVHHERGPLDRPPRLQWGAAVVAGLVGGVASILVQVLLAYLFAGDPWRPLALVGSVFTGSGASPGDPPATVALAAGITGHLVLSIVFAPLIAYLVHFWLPRVAVPVGAAAAFALFLLAYWGLAQSQPALAEGRTWGTIAGFLVYGAVTAAVYRARSRRDVLGDVLG